MKYRVGDKFIIEIECRSNIGQGLYKIKGFNTLVFDDNGLDRLEQIHKLRENWCDDCEYSYVPYGQEPCESCCHYHVSKYKPKHVEIQVGDEVELSGQQGVVVKSERFPEGRFLAVLDSEFDKHVWNSEYCKRTGKTYPDLIKALEQLPKESE